MSASAGTVDAHQSADELVVEGSGNAGINILSGNSNEGGIYFGDDGDNDIGRIRYDHTNNSLDFFVNAGEKMQIDSSGRVGINRVPGISNSKLEVGGADNVPLINVEASGVTGGMGVGSTGLQLFHGTTSFMAVDSDGDVNIAKSARIAQTALTSSSNAVAWNAKTQGNAYYTTTQNTTFSAPSNAVEGAIISVEIAQGGTAYTVAWNTLFEFAASTAPTVTATANKTDIFSFRYNGTVWQEIGRVQNMAQT